MPGKPAVPLTDMHHALPGRPKTPDPAHEPAGPRGKPASGDSLSRSTSERSVAGGLVAAIVHYSVTSRRPSAVSGASASTGQVCFELVRLL